MKKFFLKSLIALSVLFASTTMISCDNNDEPGTSAEDKITDVTFDYTIELPDSYYSYFDIEVEYTNENSEVAKEVINQNWDYSCSIKYEDTPEKVVFNVTATPKAELPAIENGTEYNITGNIKGKIIGYKQSGIKDDDFGLDISYSASGSYSSNEWRNYTSRAHKLVHCNENPR